MNQWIICSNGTMLNLSRFDAVWAEDVGDFATDIRAIRFHQNEMTDNVLLCRMLVPEENERREQLVADIYAGVCGIDLR